MDVVDLEVSFTSLVQGRALVLLLKVEELHTRGEVLLEATEDQLAVKDVLAVCDDGKQAVLVIGTAYQVEFGVASAWLWQQA